jgi:Phage integrase family
MPRRPRNQDVRDREHLTPAEGRSDRDRGQEAGPARLARCIRDQVRGAARLPGVGALRPDLGFGRSGGRLAPRRAKEGRRAVDHPLTGDEIRELRALKREAGSSRWIFNNERGAPMSPAGFARMLERAGEAAGLGLKVHPHMLRHAAGYRLANEGRNTRDLQLWLGHKNIQHTVRYTELDGNRFKGW